MLNSPRITEWLRVAALCFVVFVSSVQLTKANGRDSSPALEETVVYGRAEGHIGEASTASEGAVGGGDLAIRPLLQVAELLEVVPGMVAAQHSGSGKANQYFLRGFNLDHGTDFTNFVDSVPINMPSHGHGQGYLDLNGLIPETVDKIAYRKGTYSADSGDFSMAGSSSMYTITELERDFVSFESGSFDWLRVAAGSSSQVGDGNLTVLAQYKAYDGPWELPENLDHKSIWAKYCSDASQTDLCVSLSGYQSSWQPTEQIPEIVIGTSVCEDEFCSLEDSSIGETERWIATLSGESEDLSWATYLQYYDWRMSSNPTYDEQIHQFDERTTVGASVTRFYPVNSVVDASVGGAFRYDNISKVGVDFFKNGFFQESNGNNKIQQGSGAIFADLEWRASDRLRLNLGARSDYYHFDVRALNALSTQGKESDSIISPKLGLAYRLNDQIEAYANWGHGFHSNDARGVVNKERQVEGLVQGEGYESGLRYEKGGVTLSAVYWGLNIDSELIFVGDSNSVEPKGGSKRSGVELVGFWSPNSSLAVDATLALSNARFTEPEQAGGKYVDGSVETSGQIGVTLNHNQWDVSARFRYLGEYALVPDNSERAEPTKTLNLRAAYSFDNISLYGEVINLTDERGKDIVYFYQTNVSGFGEYEGRVSRAKEPRTFRVGIRYNF